MKRVLITLAIALLAAVALFPMASFDANAAAAAQPGKAQGSQPSATLAIDAELEQINKELWQLKEQAKERKAKAAVIKRQAKLEKARQRLAKAREKALKGGAR